MLRLWPTKQSLHPWAPEEAGRGGERQRAWACECNGGGRVHSGGLGTQPTACAALEDSASPGVFGEGPDMHFSPFTVDWYFCGSNCVSVCVRIYFFLIEI